MDDPRMSHSDSAAAARTIAAELPSGEIRIEGVDTPLPSQIAALLREAVAAYAAGKSVRLVVRDEEMTPNEAADPHRRRSGRARPWGTQNGLGSLGALQPAP